MISSGSGPRYQGLIDIERPGEAFQAQSERRKSLRLPLQWPLYVARAGTEAPLQATTRNLSNRGFYCILRQVFAVGDHFECILVIPSHVTRSTEEVFHLRCQARVVRVEKLDPVGYGLACRIESYCVSHALTAAR
ncbi:MAG: PilZ domain-containing protein [Acidobacteriia bacterium]|nr:PilZ domain-containing protein [Terriglobia bacterium]